MANRNGFFGDSIYRIAHGNPPNYFACQDLPLEDVQGMPAPTKVVRGPESGPPKTGAISTRPLGEDQDLYYQWRVTKVYDGYVSGGVEDPPRYTIQNMGSNLYAMGNANPGRNWSDPIYLRTYPKGMPAPGMSPDQRYEFTIMPTNISAPGTEIAPGEYQGGPDVSGTYSIAGTAGHTLHWPNEWVAYGTAQGQGTDGEALQLNDGDPTDQLKCWFSTSLMPQWTGGFPNLNETLTSGKQ